jgi:glycosyltransferase involved in cell wall biosynthesis
MNKIKCLFVSHALLTNIYGGATSLRTFLQYQDFLDIDLILPLFIFNIFHWPKLIRQNLSIIPPSINKVYFFPLPWSRCYEGSQISRKAVAAYTLHDKIAYFFRPIIKLFLKQPKYKFIYLNSVVLNSLTSARYKTLVHVREVLNDQSPLLPQAIDNLRKAAGLIFIDKRTYDAFKKHNKNLSHPVECVINNPFEMRAVKHLRQKQRVFKNSESLQHPNETIFSIIGSIDKIKGIDFVIKAFIKAKPKRAKLFIIGSGNITYMNYCKSIAANTKSIVFFGELQPNEMMELYAKSDYVLRGDPDFRIGRTVYEAIYAGCKVILPRDNFDDMLDPELSKFSDLILFYKPRDSDSLEEVLKEAAENVEKSSYHGPTGNISEHCQAIKTFIMQLLVD